LRGSSEHCYEGGTATDPPWGTWTVAENTVNSILWDEMLLLGIVPQGVVDRIMTVVDDDPRGTPQLPSYPPIGAFTIRAFADAYIVPAKVSEQLNANTTMAWYSQMSTPVIAVCLASAPRDVSGSDAYWATYVLMAYQAGGSEDGDPDHVRPHGLGYGETPALGYSIAGTDFSSIHVESLRDDGVVQTASGKPSASMDLVISHEVAHTGGAEDGEGGIMGDEDGADYTATQFFPKSLKALREGSSW
jgi:hypothetical protein